MLLWACLTRFHYNASALFRLSEGIVDHAMLKRGRAGLVECKSAIPISRMLNVSKGGGLVGQVWH